MNTFKKLGAGLMATLALSLSSLGDDHSKPELSPLNVVGSNADAPAMTSGLKASMSVDNSPKSLSIMSADQIKAQGLKSVGDIIDYTPGVNNSQGEGHRDAAVIRGMRTTQDFYRDGVRDDVQYYRPLYNVEQVEIIRGPDALLSGFGGAYGIINRVSKKGVIGEDFTTLSGSVDTFGEHNVQLDKNMQLNDSTALRVNVFGENLENHREFYYGDGFGVNPTLKYNLGDGSTLDLSYEYLDQERFIDRGIPTGADNKPVESLKDIVFGDPSENFSTHEAHILRAIFEHQATENLTGRLAASHSHHDKLYQNFYVPDSWGTAKTNGYDSVNGTVALDGYVDTTKRKTSIISYDLNGAFETGNISHNIVAGVEYLDTDNDNDRYHANWIRSDTNDVSFGDYDTDIFSIAGFPGNLAGGVGTTADGNTTTNYYTGANRKRADMTFADIEVLSFYLNDEISLTDSLELVVGARFDSMDIDVSGTSTGSDSDDTVSPRVGLIFDVNEQFSLYASYSETFAPRGGDQYAKLQDENDTRFDPDSFENMEFGLKYDLPMGLQFTASYFEIEANRPEEDGAGGSYLETSDTTGFELQLTGSVTDRWFISAGYTSLDAKDDDGDRLREAPEDMFSIWNNFAVSDKLALNLGIIHQGESLTKTGGTATLPEFTRIDVGASYLLSENTRFQVNVENLTDELYFPHSHSTHQASVGAPIHATFGITSSF
ncbi:MAG: TonB-dependent siderophore receptor [Verrucomicrobiota bacterium]|nr:TonB-dependent siderophore receptor [Verrucomicrobiota bacterium]